MTEEIKQEEEIQYVEIKVERESKTYRFIMPVGCSAYEAFDVAHDVAKQIFVAVQSALASVEKTEE